MSPPRDERIGIVGLGAIGGSLALALPERQRVLAWSRDPADRAAARAAGINVSGESRSAWIDDMGGVSVLVIAVPLNEVARVSRDVWRRLSTDTVVMHTASLQNRAAVGLADAEFPRVIGAHPIAGSERSGFAAANAAMFRGATVRAEARATTEQRRRIEALWRLAGIDRFVWGDAAEHDQLMSWTSHLPQLTSTALAAAFAAQEIAPADVGPGARDATRLASSDLEMWAPILHHAPPETVVALRRLTSMLEDFADGLENHDATATASEWEQARAWRARIEKPV